MILALGFLARLYQALCWHRRRVFHAMLPTHIGPRGTRRCLRCGATEVL